MFLSFSSQLHCKIVTIHNILSIFDAQFLQITIMIQVDNDQLIIIIYTFYFHKSSATTATSKIQMIHYKTIFATNSYKHHKTNYYAAFD